MTYAHRCTPTPTPKYTGQGTNVCAKLSNELFNAPTCCITFRKGEPESDPTGPLYTEKCGPLFQPKLDVKQALVYEGLKSISQIMRTVVKMPDLCLHQLLAQLHHCWKMITHFSFDACDGVSTPHKTRRNKFGQLTLGCTWRKPNCRSSPAGGRNWAGSIERGSWQAGWETCSSAP